jgi:hypothetical protein
VRLLTCCAAVLLAVTMVGGRYVYRHAGFMKLSEIVSA